MVSGAFGLAGEVRVSISTDSPRARFRKGSKWVQGAAFLPLYVLGEGFCCAWGIC